MQKAASYPSGRLSATRCSGPARPNPASVAAPLIRLKGTLRRRLFAIECLDGPLFTLHRTKFLCPIVIFDRIRPEI